MTITLRHKIITQNIFIVYLVLHYHIGKTIRYNKLIINHKVYCSNKKDINMIYVVYIFNT